MDPHHELEVFSRLGGSSAFETWLDEQESSAVKYLKSAGDPMTLHRAQGKALFIDEIKKLIAKAKSLR